MSSRPRRSAALLLSLFAGVLVPLAPAVSSATPGGAHAHSSASAVQDYVVAPGRPSLRRDDDSAPAHTGSRPDGTHLSGADHTDRRVTGTSTYDVHVLGVTTPSGAHGLTRAKAQEVIARLDAEYNRETRGLYRVRLGSYRTTSVNVSSCDLDYWSRTHGPTPAPKAGASDSTWVVVAAAPCGYSGLAYLDSAGMHVLPQNFRAAGALNDPGAAVGESEHQELDVAILAHEMGHNLGLWHARAQEPHRGTAFPGERPVEYGSHFSVMGSNQSAMRFSAAELIDLGVTPTENVGFALSPDETWTISPMTATGGTRAVVVPLGDTHHTVLSYRDGSDVDWPLKYGVSQNPDGSRASNVGVHVESETTAAPLSDVAAHDDANRTVTARPAGLGQFFAERQAFLPGESIALPGGVRVEVLMVGPSGASVRITRPADTSAPVLNPSDALSVCANAVITGARKSALSSKGNSCSAYGTTAKVALDLRPAMDDTWVSRTGVDVNGRNVALREWAMGRRRSGQGETSFAGSRFATKFTLPRGTHSVSLWVEDVFGKRTTHTSSLRLSKDQRSSGVRTLRASKVKRTSLRLSWKQPATPRAKVTDYVVTTSRWKAGRWTAPRRYRDGVSTKRSATVKKLARGSSYRITVAAKNAHGLSPVRTVTVRTAR